MSTYAPAQFVGVNIRQLSPPTSKVSYTNGCLFENNATLSLTCTISGGVSGQFLLVQVSEFNYPGATPVVTDTNTGTIAHLLGPTTFNNGSGRDDVWSITNTGAGTHTITVTFNTTASFTTETAILFSGASTTSPIDSSSTSDVAGGSSSCASVTTTSPADLLASFATISGPTLSPGIIPQNMTAPIANEYFSYATARYAGTNYVQWLGSGSTDFACDTIALH